MANWSVVGGSAFESGLGPAHCISAPNSSQQQIHFGFQSESATMLAFFL